MTLRTRLVVSLLALFAVGLVAFGVGTVRVFAGAELERLDRQLASATDVFADGLGDRLGPGRILDRFDDRRQGGPQPPRIVAPGTYAQLESPDGRVVASLQVERDAAVPDLVALGTGDAEPTTVGSVQGETRWRALARVRPNGQRLVVAVPTTNVRESVRRLVRIEGIAGGVLLLILGVGGAWVLRRGLQPLEEIAATATSIGADELDRRVPHDDEPNEVGQLATAINGMLGDLELAFAEREATEARLRRFIADASHELRTPLTSIQGFAELFRLSEERGADAEGPQVATAMRRIEQESGRMGRLVEDLLALARFDEHEPVPMDDVDLVVLAADACSDLRVAAPDRPVRLDAPDELVVTAAADELRQALANLTRNAVHHTPAATPVEVSVSRDDGTAVVRVRDHGPGLDDEALAHVFDRFWRADEARVGIGVGLGLAITAAIVERHDGTVEVANHPDGGAEFTLRLPLRGPTDRPG